MSETELQLPLLSAKPNGSAKPVSVRTATAADADELMRLARMMHAEGGMQSLDEYCVAEVFERAFAKKGGIGLADQVYRSLLAQQEIR